MFFRRITTSFALAGSFLTSQRFFAGLTAAGALLAPHAVYAQQHAQPANASAPSPALNDQEVKTMQTELIRLLRLSPTLTTVIERDPSLLSNQDYVARNNPQLAAFLAQHPEVSRNPDFYLFSHLNRTDGSPDEALDRTVWPDVYHSAPPRDGFDEFLNNMPPVFAFIGFLAAVAWMTRVFLENRRWNRIFKLQSEVHGRLIDKFSSTQELVGYMESDSGRRFLEAAPIAVNFDAHQRVPNALARVLAPLQIGVVLVLLGIGLLSLRHAKPDMDVPMLVFGTVVLMPGIGFILSAGLTWLLAARLGFMPSAEASGSSPLARNRQ